MRDRTPGVKEEDILCITFTTKAAEEMRQRIDSKINEAGLTGAKPYLINVHTFHNFTYEYLLETKGEHRILSENPLRYAVFKSLEKNKVFTYGEDYIVGDILPKIVNAIRYLKSFGILPPSIESEKSKRELVDIYNKEGIKNVTEDEILALFDYFIEAFKDYESFKPANSIDYIDMLLNFVQNYDGRIMHYKYVLVDELQDVNNLEAKIALEVGDNLFLVGDRKQAIFGFQGGSIGNFRKFEELDGMKKLKKGINHRSAQVILDYAKEHFLKNSSDPTYEDELSILKSSKDISGEVSLIVSKIDGKS